MPQPALIVTDLKRGAGAHGSVGLWVGNGTDGRFRNPKITPRSRITKICASPEYYTRPRRSIA